MSPTLGRRRLTPEERRHIGALTRTWKPRDIKRHFDVSYWTIHNCKKAMTEEPAAELAERFGYADASPAVRSLIKAYEDGKHARRQWGDQANCIYKGEHAQAWKMGFDAK
jgi:hypothetical protein